MLLSRKMFRDDGVFSVLHDRFQTLEHSYNLLPKIPNGTYTCVRGMHRLHGMTEDFETFEVTGVEGHSNLLFHVGNYNEDSEGCILVGEQVGQKLNGGKMITNSKVAFKQFMGLQAGVDSFTLVVE